MIEGVDVVALKSVVDVLDGLRKPISAAERKHRAGAVPYYGATGQVGFIDEPLFNEELVLLGEDGVQFFDSDKSKAYLIDGPSWVNNHAHVLRPLRDKVHARFLLHYLNQFDFHGYANGTTRLKLTQGAMNTIPVPLPPLNVQQRIVETLEDHLSRLDNAEQSLQAASSKSRVLLQAFAHSLYSEGDAQNASMELGDACELLAGPAFKSIDFGMPGKGIRLLRGDNIEPGSLRWSNEKTWAEERMSGFEKFLLEAGDLILAMDRPVISSGLKLALVGAEDVPSLLVQRVARLRPRDGFLPEFVLLALQTPEFIAHLFEGQTGGGVPHINMKTIASFRIPAFSIQQQKELLDQSQKLRDVASITVNDIEVSNRQLTNVRRSLLHSAFTGQLTYEDSNE